MKNTHEIRSVTTHIGPYRYITVVRFLASHFRGSRTNSSSTLSQHMKMQAKSLIRLKIRIMIPPIGSKLKNREPRISENMYPKLIEPIIFTYLMELT